MKIKRFVDKDMRAVLKRVRAEQGPDAVILSNRRIDDGIEVIAAVDYDAALMQHALGTGQGARREDASGEPVSQIGEPAPVAAPPAAATPRAEAASLAAALSEPLTFDFDRDLPGAETVPPDTADDAGFAGMRAEIVSLRGLLETQLSGLVWKETSRQSPLKAQILRNLSRFGIAPDIARLVVNRLGPVAELKHMWQQPLSALAQMLPVRSDSLLEEGGVAAMIGPTGVGKTTTIAKMAARYAMSNGTDDIALVCADAYRIGAREHLTAFGNILGIRVHAAGDSDELGAILERLGSKRLVLIDTEGVSQRDKDLTARLAALGANGADVRFYLTLPASSQEVVLDETVRSFNRVPLSGAVVTKVDEAGQLGCVLSTLIRHELPLAWIADGQRIPDDLHAADCRRLWLINRAIECMEASQPRPDERRMAEDFGKMETINA